MRAPTPSAAAELAVPDCTELFSKLNKYNTLLKGALLLKYNSRKAKYDALISKSIISNPLNLTDSRFESVDRLNEKMLVAFKGVVAREKSRFIGEVAKLDTLSPLKVLSRGYSVAEINGKVISTVKNANIGDKLNLKLSDGGLLCTVDSKGENYG